MITSKSKDFSYAAALNKARSAISLDELEIEKTKIRRAANGGILIEVLGPKGTGKANSLADKLRVVLQEDAKVARPIVKGEIRLIVLDESVTTEDVIYSIIHFGTCAEKDIKIGSIRPMSLFSVWAHCPLGAANKITSLKKIRIGWTLARVDLLESRPVQCFKCWRFGHLRNWCTSKTDFSKLCFRCGEGG